jgi:hypothetical protein
LGMVTGKTHGVACRLALASPVEWMTPLHGISER